MPVHLLHLPAESPPLVGERLQAHAGLRRPGNLKKVAVQKGRQVVHPVVGGGHGRFPDAALVQLAVSKKHVYP
jgi:hypothetical protein